MLPGFGLGVLVAKLSPKGIPLYKVAFGAGGRGYSQDYGVRIAADDAGNAYVVGTTYPYGTPFPTTSGAYQRTSAGGFSDAFIVKLNSAGGLVSQGNNIIGVVGTSTGWVMSDQQNVDPLLTPLGFHVLQTEKEREKADHSGDYQS